MKVCPYKFTQLFNERLQRLFYVSNFSRQMDLIKRQFISGVAEHVNGDMYQVNIKDIPALVVMRDATLISVGYADYHNNK